VRGFTQFRLGPEENKLFLNLRRTWRILYCDDQEIRMLSTRDLIQCELLVLRCKRRDSQAASELVSMFQRALFYYIHRLVDSEEDAWDVLQETWMSVFRSLSSLNDPCALPAFLYRVARNHALSRLRKRKLDGRLISHLDPPDPAGQADIDFTREDAAEVHVALQRLPLAHREVLTLFFLQDLSIKEIASVLTLPEGTVKSRLHHAKQSLRKLIEKGASHGT
jgi:RNA polymerase sigma-70 factor, ECF subfamily